MNTNLPITLALLALSLVLGLVAFLCIAGLRELRRLRRLREHIERHASAARDPSETPDADRLLRAIDDNE